MNNIYSIFFNIYEILRPNRIGRDLLCDLETDFIYSFDHAFGYLIEFYIMFDQNPASLRKLAYKNNEIMARIMMCKLFVCMLACPEQKKLHSLMPNLWILSRLPSSKYF